jgi:hypothetical protein
VLAITGGIGVWIGIWIFLAPETDVLLGAGVIMLSSGLVFLVLFWFFLVSGVPLAACELRIGFLPVRGIATSTTAYETCKRAPVAVRGRWDRRPPAGFRRIRCLGLMRSCRLRLNLFTQDHHPLSDARSQPTSITGRLPPANYAQPLIHGACTAPTGLSGPFPDFLCEFYQRLCHLKVYRD